MSSSKRRGSGTIGLAADVESGLQQKWKIMDYRPVGVYILRPDGSRVAASAAPSSPAQFVSFLRRALTSVGEVPVRSAPSVDLTPDRGNGLRPDGSIRLAVAARETRSGRPTNRPPVLDSMLLPAEEVRALAMAAKRPGTAVALPAHFKQLFAGLMTDDGDSFYRLDADEVTENTVTAVRSPADEKPLSVSFSGKVRAAHAPNSNRTFSSAGTVEGRITYKPSGELAAILVVFEGEYKNSDSRSAHTVTGIAEWKLEEAHK